jgi:hypothetical protein
VEGCLEAVEELAAEEELALDMFGSLGHRRICASSCSIANEVYVFTEVLRNNFLSLRDNNHYSESM